MKEIGQTFLWLEGSGTAEGRRHSKIRTPAARFEVAGAGLNQNGTQEVPSWIHRV